MEEAGSYGFKSDVCMQGMGGVDWTLLLEFGSLAGRRRWPKEGNGDHGFLVALSVDGLCLGEWTGQEVHFWQQVGKWCNSIMSEASDVGLRENGL